MRFPGGAGLRASSSRAAAYRLRPLLALKRPPTARRPRRPRPPWRHRHAAQAPRVPGAAAERRGSRWKRVGVGAWRARKGAFRVSFVPASGGRYRYYLVAKGDKATDRGSSKATVLRVAGTTGAAPTR